MRYRLIINILMKPAIFIFFFLFSINLLAQKTGLEGLASDAEIEEAREKSREDSGQVKENLIESNRAVSDWFNSVTQGLDLFLVGKKVTSAQSDSKIILENTSYSREGSNFTNLTSISVNPRFPNLEAYWNLKFSTYDDSTTSPQPEKGYATRTPRDKNYAATIGLFRKIENVRLAFQPRIELQDPLQVSHYISVETVYGHDKIKKLKINPKLQLFAHATKGTGTFQALNFNYEISDVYSLTFINEGEYEDKTSKYSVTNGVSLGHLITNTAALADGFNFYSNNRPNYHLEAYSLSTTWSDVIYSKILDYQISPHLDFVKDENFRGFIGVIFTLSLRF